MIKDNKEDVDVDLYGRGFDGIFGPGAEAVGRRERAVHLKKQHDRKTSVRKGDFVDRDLYGRGDPRIFGAAAFIGNAPLSTGDGTPRRRILLVRPGLMGKVSRFAAKVSRRYNEEDFELEELTPVGSSNIEENEDTNQLSETLTGVTRHDESPLTIEKNNVRSGSTADEGNVMRMVKSIDGDGDVLSGRTDEPERPISIGQGGRVLRMINTLEHPQLTPENSREPLAEPKPPGPSKIETTPVTPASDDRATITSSSSSLDSSASLSQSNFSPVPAESSLRAEHGRINKFSDRIFSGGNDNTTGGRKTSESRKENYTTDRNNSDAAALGKVASSSRDRQISSRSTSTRPSSKTSSPPTTATRRRLFLLRRPLRSRRGGVLQRVRRLFGSSSSSTPSSSDSNNTSALLISQSPTEGTGLPSTSTTRYETAEANELTTTGEFVTAHQTFEIPSAHSSSTPLTTTGTTGLIETSTQQSSALMSGTTGVSEEVDVTLEDHTQSQIAENRNPGVGHSSLDVSSHSGAVDSDQLLFTESSSYIQASSSVHFSTTQGPTSTTFVHSSSAPLSSTKNTSLTSTTTQGSTALHTSATAQSEGLNVAHELHPSSDTREDRSTSAPSNSTRNTSLTSTTTQGSTALHTSATAQSEGLNVAHELHPSSDTLEDRSNMFTNNADSSSAGISSHSGVSNSDDLVAVTESSSRPPSSGLHVSQSQNSTSLSISSSSSFSPENLIALSQSQNRLSSSGRSAQSSALEHPSTRGAYSPNQITPSADSPGSSTPNKSSSSDSHARNPSSLSSQSPEPTGMLQSSPPSTYHSLNAPPNITPSSELDSVMGSSSALPTHPQNLEGGSSTTSSTIRISSKSALEDRPRSPSEHPSSSQSSSRDKSSPPTSTDNDHVSHRVAELERINSQILERVEQLERMVSEQNSLGGHQVQGQQRSASSRTQSSGSGTTDSTSNGTNNDPTGSGNHAFLAPNSADILNLFDDQQSDSTPASRFTQSSKDIDFAITGAYSVSSRELSNLAIDQSNNSPDPRQQGELDTGGSETEDLLSHSDREILRELVPDSEGYSRSGDLGLGSASDSNSVYIDNSLDNDANTTIPDSDRSDVQNTSSVLSSAVHPSSSGISSHSGAADSDDVTLVAQSPMGSFSTKTSSRNRPDSDVMTSGQDVASELEQQSSTGNCVPSTDVPDEASVSGSGVIDSDFSHEVHSSTVYETSSATFNTSNNQTSITDSDHSSRASSSLIASSSRSSAMNSNSNRSMESSASRTSRSSNPISNLLDDSDLDSDDSTIAPP